jgi:hypothetical protein
MILDQMLQIPILGIRFSAVKLSQQGAVTKIITENLNE